jgi:hypothetical protein
MGSKWEDIDFLQKVFTPKLKTKRSAEPPW